LPVTVPFDKHDLSMSIDRIHEKVLELLLAEPGWRSWTRYLDIGAGRGSLIARVKEKLNVEASVCDYTDELMRLPGQKVDVANLNHEPLPYPDVSFDVVTATEVIEHLEDFRRVVREIHRVLKPGGVCILSTPNILNLNSRLRFLTFGFWNLFGPLPVQHSALYSTGGHINPVSWFYVAHALLDAGFPNVTPHIDRKQRSALPKLVLLYPFIKLFAAWAMRKERVRFKTLDEANVPLVQAMNTTDMLLGRTIITKSVKSA
jgi:ubiquinone/menaquinone biosynthesis C-methylase UbiE